MEYCVARSEPLFEAVSLAAKGMASPRRLELLDLLAQAERSVDGLAQAAGLGVTSVSAHLQTLRRAGLVATRRDGTKVFYRLAGEDVAGLLTLLQSVARAHVGEVESARREVFGADDGEPLEAVSSTELLVRARAGDVVVLDVRPVAEFDAGHIPGAVSIPVAELEDRLGELPAGVEVVAYCRGALCVMSHDAARLLRGHGRRVAVLEAGMLEWRGSGRPISSEAA